MVAGYRKYKSEFRTYNRVRVISQRCREDLREAQKGFEALYSRFPDVISGSRYVSRQCKKKNK
ncbi:hypothetical protein DN748_16085 [Sinomicrobium soli]|nr:hypothetical protein DN748_16085 [Sinomicrobium sp. N-1-3-6]